MMVLSHPVDGPLPQYGVGHWSINALSLSNTKKKKAITGYALQNPLLPTSVPYASLTDAAARNCATASLTTHGLSSATSTTGRHPRLIVMEAANVQILSRRLPFSHVILLNTSGCASRFSAVSVSRAMHLPARRGGGPAAACPRPP